MSFGIRTTLATATLLATGTTPAPLARAQGIEPFRQDQRLAATYYFNWYIDGRTAKYHNWRVRPDPDKNPIRWAWQPCYPKGQEPGAEIFGLHDPTLWPGKRLPNTAKWPDSDDYLYHVAELRAMKWVGLDFVFVDVWWPHDFVQADAPETRGKRAGRRKGTPEAELAALFQAWRYLDGRGERPVKLAMMLETPSFPHADVRSTTPGGVETLFEPIWAFYRQFLGEGKIDPVIPRRALAAIEIAGRIRLIVNLFYPRGKDVPNGEWISRWDEGTFTDLRARFEGMAGLPLYICVNQHLHGPRYGGWDGVQADGRIVEISRKRGLVDQEITWHASLAGPNLREDSIAIGAGYFARQKDSRPGGGALRADGSPVYPRAYRYIDENERISSYERQWIEALGTPAGFQKHLLVIEAWNELGEGTQVSPSKPEVLRDAEGRYIDRWGDTPTQYLELTRKYIRIWKGSDQATSEGNEESKAGEQHPKPSAGLTSPAKTSPPATRPLPARKPAPKRSSPRVKRP